MTHSENRATLALAATFAARAIWRPAGGTVLATTAWRVARGGPPARSPTPSGFQRGPRGLGWPAW